MAAIPLPPAPPAPVNQPEFTYHGVYFDDSRRAGYWKAILRRGHHVRHIKVPNSDQYMSRERAEQLGREMSWND